VIHPGLALEDGRRVPDELLHRCRPDDRLVREEDLALIGKARKIPHRLPDDRTGRLRTAVEQEQALLDDLRDVQWLAVDRPVDPGRGQVVARVVSAGRDQLAEGGDEFADGGR
jgi:hypothetical protein